MRYGIAVNTENCMACYNCVMACKDEHCGFATSVSASQPHEGQFWVNICSKERGDDPADGAEITLTDTASGEKLSTKTNYFGDWEFENLKPDTAYDIEISFPGYKTVKLSALTDTDHYVAETVLEKE